MDLCSINGKEQQENKYITYILARVWPRRRATITYNIKSYIIQLHNFLTYIITHR